MFFLRLIADATDAKQKIHALEVYSNREIYI